METDASDQEKRPSNRMINPNHLVQKKFAASSFQDDLQKLDLKELLSRSLEGKAIMNVYLENKYLEDDDRDSLSDIIVKWLLFRCTKPDKHDFFLLRQKILDLFPTEVNVYYSAPKEEGETQTLARGKLFDRTRNVKEWMRKKGLLERVRGQKRASASGAKEAINTFDVELTAEISDAIKWLKVMRQPWTTVENKWALTSAYRHSCLLKSRPEVNKKGKKAKSDFTEKVSSYLDTYKVLRESKGYLLIDIDFTLQYGDKAGNSMALKWPVFRNCLLSIVKSNPSLIKDPEGKKILDLLFKAHDDEWINIYVMQLLSSLITPSRIVEFGKKKFKPTIKESRDFFLCSVNKANEVENFISQRRTDVYDEYGAAAKVQPYVLYVASAEDNNAVPSCFYIVIDNFSYLFRSVVQSVDVCLKVFFSLDIDFPVHCAHIWLLLQNFIYEITTPDDESINNVKTFISKLNALCK